MKKRKNEKNEKKRAKKSREEIAAKLIPIRDHRWRKVPRLTVSQSRVAANSYATNCSVRVQCEVCRLPLDCSADVNTCSVPLLAPRLYSRHCLIRARLQQVSYVNDTVPSPGRCREQCLYTPRELESYRILPPNPNTRPCVSEKGW